MVHPARLKSLPPFLSSSFPPLLGGRQKEGQYINKSLLALGHVIQKLSSTPSSAPLSSQHIPFRDSKLTRFLQPSLEVCITPSRHRRRRTEGDSRSLLPYLL